MGILILLLLNLLPPAKVSLLSIEFRDLQDTCCLFEKSPGREDGGMHLAQLSCPNRCEVLGGSFHKEGALSLGGCHRRCRHSGEIEIRAGAPTDLPRNLKPFEVKEGRHCYDARFLWK